jgi:4'-phosphopantetheinyl transferase
VIYISYTRIGHRLKFYSYNFYFQNLPQKLQAKILRFRKWQDAQRSLLGKALLLKSLKYLNLSEYSLFDLNFTKHDRPFFDNVIDFNISHSGDYIICAINQHGKIGIDIEEIKDILVEEFKDNFSTKEWVDIITSKNKLFTFYSYWTKKEAFLKAIGVGLNIPLNEAEVHDNKIVWNDTNWFFHEVKIDDICVSYFSCESLFPEVLIQKIDFE